MSLDHSIIYLLEDVYSISLVFELGIAILLLFSLLLLATISTRLHRSVQSRTQH